MVIIINGNHEVTYANTLGDALDFVDAYTKLIDVKNKTVYEYDDNATLDDEYPLMEVF